MKTRILITALATSTLLAGCAMPGSSAGVYSKDQMGQAQTVEFGRITSVQKVKVQGDNNPLITMGGTALGGLAGSNVGKGSGAVAGAIVGAMAGGLATQSIQQNMTQEALELTVELDKGRTISVVQAADVPFTVGQRVRVLTGGGSTRVTPAQ